MAMLGGYGSCRPGPFGQQMFEHAASMRRKLLLEKKFSTRIFLSCYGTKDKFAYSFSSSNLSKINRFAIDDVVKSLEEEIEKTRTKTVTIIGHSYGGWLSLQVASRLASRYQIIGLVTIDPISQVLCKPHQLGTRLILQHASEPIPQGCLKAPADITTTEYEAISKKTKWWYQFYQEETSFLHSGPIEAADRNELSKYAGRIEDLNHAHGLMVADERLWRVVEMQVLNDPLGEKTNPDQKTLVGLGSIPPPKPESEITKPVGEMTIRIFNRYQKEALSIYPSSAAKKEAGKKDIDSPDVAVYQPNVEPSVGFSVVLGDNVSVGIAQSLSKLNLRKTNKGSSKVQHYELHYNKARFGADIYLQQYQGFFLDHIPERDTKIFNDGIFKTGTGLEKFPDMVLRSIGVDGFYIFNPESFSLPAAMTQRAIITKSGFSPVIMESLRFTQITNNGPIISEDDAEFYAEDAGLSGGIIRTIGVLPGFAGSLVHGPYSFSAVLNWGVAYQVLQLNDVRRNKTGALSSIGNVRGSLVYNTPNYLGGFTGYKTVISNSGRSLGISEGISNIEGFFGFHF